MSTDQATVACAVGVHVCCDGTIYSGDPPRRAVAPCNCACHAIEPHVDNEGYEVYS